MLSISPASLVAAHWTLPLSPDWRLINVRSFLLFIWILPVVEGGTFWPLWNQIISGVGVPVALHLKVTDSWGYLSAIVGVTVNVGITTKETKWIFVFNILKTDENPIEQVSIDCQEKYALALVLIYDGLWLVKQKLFPPSQPIRYKTKSKSDLVTLNSNRLLKTFSLCSGWLLRSVWLRF